MLAAEAGPDLAARQHVDAGSANPYTGGMKPYEKDYTDRSRDIANGLFLSGYILLMGDIGLFGAGLYLLGECFLTPHTIRTRSWSTLFASVVFAIASIYKIVKTLFF